MTKNEIKKALYKEKPEAHEVGVGGVTNEDNFPLCRVTYKYRCMLKDATVIYFSVPEDEAEGFDETMPAYLLIRWMV